MEERGAEVFGGVFGGGIHVREKLGEHFRESRGQA